MFPFILLGVAALAAIMLSKKDEAKAATTPALPPGPTPEPPVLPNGATLARAERAASIVREAMASGSSDAMLAAAAQLRTMGMTEAAAALETAAAKLSSKAAEAASVPGSPPVTAAPSATTAAITATKAAAVVNKAAEAIAAPSAASVKAVAKDALSLAQSAPPQAKTEARAVLEATKQAIATPDAATVATLARASTELAKASATPATAQAATAANEAAKKLEAAPTPENASKTSAVTSTAANTAIKASGAPIAEPGRTTYVVAKGDSAWLIAKKITGNGARYKELLTANPQKTTKLFNDGYGNMIPNFSTLSEREVLKLPASWVSAAPAATVAPPATPAPGGEGTATPGWVMDLGRMKIENPLLYEATMKVKNSTDPAVLTRAAELVRAKYPQLAMSFLFWAEQARKGASATSPGILPGAPAPTTVSTDRPKPATTPATPPTAPPTTYTVLPGDSAWRIAQKLAGSGLKWKELVAINSQKKKSADGNFATLFAGEVLKVPPSWASVTPMTVGMWPRPARTLAGMGMAPVAA
jgi:LysM repeat protein